MKESFNFPSRWDEFPELSLAALDSIRGEVSRIEILGSATVKNWVAILRGDGRFPRMKGGISE